MSDLASTQRERVLKALRNAGPQGVTQADFIRYPTFDGKAPITRLAARIEELRDEGHPIDSSRRRNRCSVYVLCPAPVETDVLFTLPARNAILGDAA